MHIRNLRFRVISRPAYTLIELLIVIAIIMLLIGLMMPAVQAAREAGKRTQCMNNLKQMSLACLNHENQYGRLPTGGWGWLWNGDPDRGTNRRQPGGWAFNILPFTEQQSLHEYGAGLPSAAKRTAIAQRLGVKVSIFVCPSRRSGGPYTNGWNVNYYDCDPVAEVVRGDYAANAGSLIADEFTGGPPSLAAGDSPGYPWQNTANLTGVIFQRSEIANSDITRGRSSVYLLGEKYLNADRYTDGMDAADNENVFAGFDNDNTRSTYAPPLRDRPGYYDFFRFGSVHRSSFMMSYCDGSVRAVDYSVDPTIHQAAGSRK